MRVLWGRSMDEIAEMLDFSKPTAQRDRRFARTRLAERLGL